VHWCGPSGTVAWLAGYRFFRLREGLLIGEQLTVTEAGGLIAQGTEFEIFDSFRAENDFHGAEIGVVGEWWNDMWTVELLAKVAVGNLHRETAIEGLTVTRTPPPTPVTSTASGGLLALSPNSGTRISDTFTALPEVGVNLQLQLSPSVSLTVGYSLLVLPDVFRTGDMIDRTVNPTFIPGNGPPSGPERPAVVENESDFWAQGLNIGLLWQG
jgi:hypothetical protein